MADTLPHSVSNSSLSSSLKSSLSIKNMSGKVGSYAISTVDFSSWSSDSNKQAPTKIRKARAAKEVINPIFAECAQITPDPFWSDKFTAASIGKFPHKFNFHDNVLTFRKGARCHNLEITNNPYETAAMCMEFFRVNGGIFSPTDEQNATSQQSNDDGSEPEPLTWASANKKVQECLVSYYLMAMEKKMELSSDEIENLRQTILLGVANKYFGNHNILVENDHIHSITGLSWDPTTRNFFIDPNLKPLTTRTYSRVKDKGVAPEPAQKDMIPQFGAKWAKYIDSLEKKIASRIRKPPTVTIIYPNTTPNMLSTMSMTTSVNSIRSATSATSANSTDRASLTDVTSTAD